MARKSEDLPTHDFCRPPLARDRRLAVKSDFQGTLTRTKLALRLAFANAQARPFVDRLHCAARCVMRASERKQPSPSQLPRLHAGGAVGRCRHHWRARRAVASGDSVVASRRSTNNVCEQLAADRNRAYRLSHRASSFQWVAPNGGRQEGRPSGSLRGARICCRFLTKRRLTPGLIFRSRLTARRMRRRRRLSCRCFCAPARREFHRWSTAAARVTTAEFLASGSPARTSRPRERC